MTNQTLKTASVLAFERKLDPSDAIFFAGDWDSRENHQSWKALGIREKLVRGTISNRMKTKDQDPAKLDAKKEDANLQTVDVSALPADMDTLKVSFTLRVLQGTGTPSACNEAAYQEKLIETINGYVEKNSFTELSKRYAYNLANGRFLWRNRLGAEDVEVHVSKIADGKSESVWQFDALSLGLRSFEESSPELQALSGVIEAGLRGEQHTLMKITAFVRMGEGQEVFPSQELVLDRSRGDKSKTLYEVDGVAAIHSQKIGNAIRTIDTWYEGAEELGPIAVEPYGSVTTQGKAYRQPKQKMDFYSLLDGWILKDKAPDINQQHFVVATLIRGGVFGESDK